MSRDLNRDWALRYAETGISVFPCAADNKCPLIRWRSGSATNAGCIAAMWNRWPGSLVGIDLHKCGLIVFDADRHNGRADGVSAFATLLRKTLICRRSRSPTPRIMAFISIFGSLTNP